MGIKGIKEKTHCLRGHERTPENITPNLACRKCISERESAVRRLHREENPLVRKSKKGTGPITPMKGKFGRWTVLRYDKEQQHSRKAYWICRCECGVERSVDGGSLRAGTSVSCGCYKISVTMASEGRNTKPAGVCALNCLYSNYKLTGAKARGLEFSLTKAEFGCLTKEPCTYCGIPPSQVFTNGGKASPYIYNGIDRVDSNKGYTIVNTVPCCKTCNYAKSNLTLAEFMLWLDRVVKFRTQQNPESPVNDGGEKQPCRST